MRVAFVYTLLLWPLLVHGQTSLWRPASGDILFNDPAGAIAIHPGSADTVYAECWFGFYRSTDRGETWGSFSWPRFSHGALAISPVDPQVMWASTLGWTTPTGNNIHQSTDGGMTWTHIFLGWFYPPRIVQIDPGDSSVVYVGIGPLSLARSSNLGQSWEMVPTPPGFALLSLAIARTNNNVMYLEYFDQIYKSTDRGATWSPVSVGFDFSTGARLAIDPRDENVVYAGVYSDGSTPGGMFKSTDGGVTWIEKNNGLSLEDRQVNTLFINPERPDELLLGLFDGPIPLFRTTDGGASWNRYDAGIPTPSGIHSIAIDTANERYYAGVGHAGAAGIFLLDIVNEVDTISSLLPQVIVLHQNYPNPFNPATTIRFDIVAASQISLRVYDLLGREIRTLANGEYPKGTYAVQWDGKDNQGRQVTTGVYLIQLTHNGGTLTRKMAMVK